MKKRKTINDTLNQNKNKKSFPSEFISSDENSNCDHKTIANDFFINIGENENNGFSPNTTIPSYEKYLDNITTNLRFRSVTSADIMQLIESLKPKTSYNKTINSNDQPNIQYGNLS